MENLSYGPPDWRDGRTHLITCTNGFNLVGEGGGGKPLNKAPIVANYTSSKMCSLVFDVQAIQISFSQTHQHVFSLKIIQIDPLVSPL